MNTPEMKLVLKQPRDLLQDDLPALRPAIELPGLTAAALERHFRNAPRKKPWVLELCVEQNTQAQTIEVQEAIRGHYAQQTQSTEEDLVEYRHTLRRAFLYGGIFLGTCLLANQFLGAILGESFPRIFDEGLIIIGWVALWRPAELLTYEWIPLFRRLHMVRALSKLTLNVKTP